MDEHQPTGPSGSAPTGETGAAPQTSERTGTYELVTIVPATVGDDALPGVQEKVRTAILAHGLAVSEEEDLGKRKFAFPIQHIRQGFYRLYKLEGPRRSIRPLESELRLMPDVLRHLLTVRTVKTPAQLEAEAALRERIQAKRIAADERAANERRAKEAERLQQTAPTEPAQPVSPEELEKKLAEILTDDTLGE